jgi:signal transduction histidine kinase
MPAMILAVISAILRYRRSRGLERQQMKWPGLALGLVIVLAGINQLVPGLASWDARSGFVLTWSMAMLLPVSIGIAILRHNLWDIDILINRTVVYGTLTALIVVIYIAIVSLFGLLFRTQNNGISGLIATGIIAVLFQPLRDRLQRRVDRLFYGERDDPSAILTRLADQVQSGESTSSILPNLVQTIAQALKIPYAAIEKVNEAGQLELVASWGQKPDHVEIIPLTFQIEQVGKLLIAHRSAGEQFDRDERQLLNSIAALTANAVHAVQLSDELRHSRQRIVTAREEERRRLRRDLHDGLGPQLASQTLGLKALQQLLVTAPEQARDLLVSLMEQSQEAIKDVRRLVYELRPPTLDSLGLVGALQQSAARMANNALQVTVDVPEPLPELPAAVETAVFRISQEAMTNIVRHSGAQQATIRLNNHERQLCVEVSDDGQGFSVRDYSGIGLESMRERAAELNGSCVIESRLGKGTTIKACLPLEDDDA